MHHSRGPAFRFVSRRWSLSIVMGLSLFWRILLLMLIIYAPLQIVIIVSTIWAVRSRWEEKEQK